MSTAPENPKFPTTEWTLIGRLRSADEPVARRALEDLCAQYHYPLYCYIRRRGHSHHDAEDMLQEFFSKLLRLDVFGSADADKGRLRAYLVTAMQRFLTTWTKRDNKRQQSQGEFASLQRALHDSEGRYLKEAAPAGDNPEMFFERKWAQQLLARALANAAAAYATKGKGELFALLSPSLLDGGSLRGRDPVAMAKEIGMKPNTLRVAFGRLLRDFRAALEDEIFQTVATRSAVEEELTHLRRIVSGGAIPGIDSPPPDRPMDAG